MAHPKPDAFEKRLRFGCGFTVGGLIAFFSLVRGLADTFGWFWPCVIVVALGFGWSAMRHGDAFWEELSKWMRWW